MSELTSQPSFISEWDRKNYELLEKLGKASDEVLKLQLTAAVNLAEKISEREDLSIGITTKSFRETEKEKV